METAENLFDDEVIPSTPDNSDIFESLDLDEAISLVHPALKNLLEDDGCKDYCWIIANLNNPAQRKVYSTNNGTECHHSADYILRESIQNRRPLSWDMGVERNQQIVPATVRFYRGEIAVAVAGAQPETNMACADILAASVGRMMRFEIKTRQQEVIDDDLWDLADPKLESA